MFGNVKKLLLTAALAGGVLSPALMADEDNIPEEFRGATPGSPLEIRYDDWSAILQATVLDAGMSDRSSAGDVRAELGTRTIRGNSSSTRNEGNRLAFPAFADHPDNLKVVAEIKAELEALPDQIPLKYWSRNEQMAYWLNLHNIALIEELAQEYPIKSLKKLQSGSRKNPGLWDRKVVTVAGHPLSLNNIHELLVEKWDTTLVMYGMFQGYVGGPSIPSEAFTGATVHKLLVANAREFVNSNRGMRLRGNTLQISEYYKENRALFPDWEEDLKNHFVSLTNYSLHDRIRNARKIKATTDDYYIADLYGGTRSNGSAVASNRAALNDMLVGVNSGQFVPTGPGGDTSGASATPSVNQPTGGSPSTGEVTLGIAAFTMESYGNFRKADIDLRFPPHVMEYIDHVRKARAAREGHVDVEDVTDDNSKQ
ncbi:DUF547 domain-containing protein [Kordiimonas aestuarii]|uniref:DUF547 domain-containing protein n=1 Tax=Kordiimonas aestuarii TaxID=1005925 RepID=UPI0021CEDB08|nr:DUF547 domain-containing protein [Kordiimonas aestuarii]